MSVLRRLLLIMAALSLPLGLSPAVSSADSFPPFRPFFEAGYSVRVVGDHQFVSVFSDIEVPKVRCDKKEHSEVRFLLFIGTLMKSEEERVGIKATCTRSNVIYQAFYTVMPEGKDIPLPTEKIRAGDRIAATIQTNMFSGRASVDLNLRLSDPSLHQKLGWFFPKEIPRKTNAQGRTHGGILVEATPGKAIARFGEVTFYGSYMYSSTGGGPIGKWVQQGQTLTLGHPTWTSPPWGNHREIFSVVSPR